MGFYRNIVAAHGALSSLRPYGNRDIDYTLFGMNNPSSSFSKKMVPTRKRTSTDLVLYRPNKYSGGQSRGRGDTVMYQAPPTPPLGNRAAPFKKGKQSSGSNNPLSFLKKNMPLRLRGGNGRRRRLPGRRRPVVVRRRKFRNKRRSKRSVTKKKRKMKVNFAKKGSIFKWETGGTLSDAQSIFLGHTLAWQYVWGSAMRAVIRELFRQKGEHIVSWQDQWLGGVTTMRVSFKYGDLDVNSLSQGNYDFPASTTYETLAAGLGNAIITALAGVTRGNIYDIWINEQVSPSATVALVNFNQCTLHFACNSTLKVQNATLGGVDDIGDELVLDIHNRPIVGKVYKSKKVHTGFVPIARYIRGTAEVGYQSYLGSVSTGLITARNATTLNPLTKKPPAGYFFNATAQGVKIHPGKIKYDKWSWSKDFNGSTFLNKFSPFVIVAVTGNQSIPIGPAQMFGLEKEIDTRSGETNISCGYQIDQTYMCAITHHVPKCVALMSVTT